MSTLTLNNKYCFEWLDSIPINRPFLDRITTLFDKLKAETLFDEEKPSGSKNIPSHSESDKTPLPEDSTFVAMIKKGDVFINAAWEDSELANEIIQSLKKHNIPYRPPLDISAKPTEMRKNLEQNLLSCRAVLILYDKAHLVWVVQQLRYCQRIRTLRKQALDVWVYTSSKEFPSKKDLKTKFHLNIEPDSISKSKLEEFLSSEVS